MITTNEVSAEIIKTFQQCNKKSTEKNNCEKGEVKEISLHSNSFPRLKNGVYISRPVVAHENSIVVATSTLAIEIFHAGARSIIAQLTGTLSPEEISQNLSAPIQVIDKVLTQLKDANFIDTVRNKIILHNRFQSAIAARAAHTADQSQDAAFSQLQKRLAPELSQATWLEGIKDGGVELLSSRQNFGIEIFGSTRTATLICSILLASGVTNTRISLTSTQKHPTISDADLGTGALRTSDIGLNFRGRVEELSREWSLFPVSSHKCELNEAASELIPQKNLRIVVGEYEPELIEHFTRDQQEHLFVGKLAGGIATCGPLVQPGLTPCARCLSLGAEERYGEFHSQLTAAHGTSDELPIAVAHQLAAITAHTVLRFIDTGESDLAGAQVQLKYLEPLIPVFHHFSRHPKCACIWSNSSPVSLNQSLL